MRPHWPKLQAGSAVYSPSKQRPLLAPCPVPPDPAGTTAPFPGAPGLHGEWRADLPSQDPLLHHLRPAAQRGIPQPARGQAPGEYLPTCLLLGVPAWLSIFGRHCGKTSSGSANGCLNDRCSLRLLPRVDCAVRLLSGRGERLYCTPKCAVNLELEEVVSIAGALMLRPPRGVACSSCTGLIRWLV
ncbi:hypothetical protein SKAU_G00303730 [Synaphobranchus kaupii]|uniref:Uncharacterized protein n=1 Tax=Synaphobranchus kaupii TaxID=118154 RepID=A0A9Q1ILE3_SYNKA|nr:hypothetical protein SKAU_G00303730 [Synaphobranchus kaupii]